MSTLSLLSHVDYTKSLQRNEIELKQFLAIDCMITLLLLSHVDYMKS